MKQKVLALFAVISLSCSTNPTDPPPANCQMVRETVYHADYTVSGFRIHTYDASGNKESDSMFADSIGWLNAVLEYDMAGNTIKETSFRQNGSIWDIVNYVNIYDPVSKLLTKRTRYKYDTLFYGYDIFTYNSAGLVESDTIYNYDGFLAAWYIYEYDSEMRLVGNRYHLQHTGTCVSWWVFDYDTQGNKTMEQYFSPELEHTTTYEYDANNRLVRETLDDNVVQEADQSSEYEYNDAGYVSRRTYYLPGHVLWFWEQYEYQCEP